MVLSPSLYLFCFSSQLPQLQLPENQSGNINTHWFDPLVKQLSEIKYLHLFIPSKHLTTVPPTHDFSSSLSHNVTFMTCFYYEYKYISSILKSLIAKF